MKFGKYKALVTATNDPDKLGRIKIKCAEVYGQGIEKWALPCFMPNTFSLPSKDDIVWIEFAGGQLNAPIWCGVLYTAKQLKELLKDEYDVKKVLMTSSGEFSILSKGDMSITSTDKNVDVTSKENTTIKTKQLVADTAQKTVLKHVDIIGNQVSTGNVNVSEKITTASLEATETATYKGKEILVEGYVCSHSCAT
jgi:hypothetical protein